MIQRTAFSFAFSLATAACAASGGPTPPAQPSPVESSPAATAASYTVAVEAITPAPRLSVRAELRLTDDTLRMVETRPGDAPELMRHGWPALVRNLRVLNESGTELPAISAGAAGWALPAGGRNVTVAYDIDYELLVNRGWPAPRESAYADDSTLFIVARSLFVGSHTPGPVSVRFVVPAGWRVLAPWGRDNTDTNTFRVGNFERLANNAFAVTRASSATVRAGDVTLQTVTFGRWRSRAAEVAAALRAHAATFARLFDDDSEHRYLAAFLEAERMGGEAYLDSYAMQADPSSPASGWSRLVAHELFHYWNGQRLRGEDYIASQWFAEGITEYFALLSMAQNGLMSEQEVLDQLSSRLRASQGMTASLVESGGRKNAAFYGRAAITGLLLDLLLREQTANRRGLPDLMRALWREYGRTDRPYTLTELYAAASAVAGADLAPRIRGWVERADPPEADALLATAALRVIPDSAGQRIAIDPTGSATARARLRSILSQ
jgi:predicted metalloprotease with PDZ domain